MHLLKYVYDNVLCLFKKKAQISLLDISWMCVVTLYLLCVVPPCFSCHHR